MIKIVEKLLRSKATSIIAITIGYLVSAGILFYYYGWPIVIGLWLFIATNNYEQHRRITDKIIKMIDRILKRIPG